MAGDLTPDNFIRFIKNMNPRHRNKLTADRLIELILQRADLEDNQNTKLENRPNDLETKFETLKAESLTNTLEIEKIKMAPPLPEAPANGQSNYDEEFNVIHNQMREMQNHIHSIEQYLRINNIEIVGLPEPTEDESNEQIMIEALNHLDLNNDVAYSDIDIAHPIPTRRQDGKRVSVCKFVSRKTKIDILEAKKKSKVFKFRGNDIYINEHLSPEHRRIFAEASAKRKEFQFKYIWTNNGITHLRKEDGSPMITIENIEDLNYINE